MNKSISGKEITSEITQGQKQRNPVKFLKIVFPNKCPNTAYSPWDYVLRNIATFICLLIEIDFN